MDMIQILGLVAGACTSVAAAPQLVKTWKTKNVQDVSVRMFILYVIGNGLWLVYGIFKSDFPIIITNAIALLINGCMLYLKLRYKNNHADAQQDTDKRPQLSTPGI